MVKSKRSKENPLFYPNKNNSWEAEAAFNGSVVKIGQNYSMLYRALSLDHLYQSKRLKLSTIGICQSGDGLHFRKRRQFITTDKPWDKYGCEDPRITYFEGKYFIFYTALSAFPPDRESIKVAVAVTNDLETVEEKHLVTPFNAKAFALFPERINGKIAALLTVNTDKPPAKICLAQFDRIDEIWQEEYWHEWYKNWQEKALPIYHTENDHLEVGSVPIKTDEGWVLIFCYIENYFNGKPLFRIDACLLDNNNPQKLIGQTVDPLLIPEEQYELYGLVPNIIFPSGALLDEGQLHIYYSACDTSICRASVTLKELLSELKMNPQVNPHHKRSELLARYDGNPLISPITDHPWESKYTFNAGALLVDEKIYILYRAMGDDDTSVLGLASTRDGLKLDERLSEPVYLPREQFEMKIHPGFSGCEDPRLTLIDETIYMCYTAYDGINPPRIALTSIAKNAFLSKNWEWQKPKLISAPGMDNKDSCLVSGKIDDRYLIFHRINPCIWIDFVTDLDFADNHFLGGHPLMGPRVNSWDNLKIGLKTAGYFCIMEYPGKI